MIISKKNSKFCVVVGTRPEIIKQGPIIKELEKKELDFFILHTGQHFSYDMDKIFFQDLKLPNPRYNLNVSKILNAHENSNTNKIEDIISQIENPDGCTSHGKQMGLMTAKIEEILQKEKPEIVLVHGDTNTTLSAALAAVKLHIKIAHVEAGLRSGDNSMPEEINRILVDRISDYLLCPTEEQKKNLLKEGIPESKIHIVGNTIVDAVYQNLKTTDSDEFLKKYNVESKQFMFLTLHREENVDNKETFEKILRGISTSSQKSSYSVLYSAHPRAVKRAKEFNITIPSEITVISPVSYFDSLHLQKEAKIVLTDSGGLQEEALILGTPCVTLRDNTERPETICANTNILAGSDPEKIVQCIEYQLKNNASWINPYGTGRSAEKILSVLLGCLNKENDS